MHLKACNKCMYRYVLIVLARVCVNKLIYDRHPQEHIQYKHH